MPRSLFALPLLLILLPPAARSDQASLPACQAPATLRKTVKDQLDSPEFNRLAYSAQIERKQQVLSGLMKRYPREVEPYTLWIAAAREDQLLHPELLAELQKDLSARATAHPDDPLALYIAAHALIGTDTPQSISMLQKAQSLAPRFPQPALDLAQIYADGKFADKTKFADQLTKFWTACPGSEDRQASWMLVKNPELQAKVAAALRPMLAKSTDPDLLKDYEFLWGLEFRTTPPPKYGDLRREVAADVNRIEGIKNPHPDAEWADLILKGEKQAEAAPETIRAKEDALIAAYPHSDQANGIVCKRWEKAHPKPTDQKDTAAWKAYNDANWAVTQQWIEQYPDSYFPTGYSRFFFAPDEAIPNEQQGVAMAEKCISDGNTYIPPSMRMYVYYSASSRLLDRRWAPEKALEYAQQAKQWQDRTEAQYRAEDNHSPSDLKDHGKNVAHMSRDLDGQILLAAMRANRPDAVASIQASVEAPRSPDDKDESGYWLRRARLAAVEGHQQDALGYYQLALRARLKPPSYVEGKLQDDLGDETHALWTKLGGTEVAWAAWSAPSTPTNAAKADEARWEKPTKTLPTFQLADLSGKTWSVKSLNGKVVLINLWATWCGPCNAELPQLQKLYEQAKARSDLQILTLNIDEDPGLIEPFMKEKGYTFPVIPAYSYVVNLLDGYAIPQNWVLSPKGDWEWTQIGYGSDDAWVKDMLAKLDTVKAGG
ncbi:MAG TPA: TlpA disulfide reductase family protein [Acidobacteriaceae bacterium]|jgi:thiol-disulfide isomerase/thioredoxin